MKTKQIRDLDVSLGKILKALGPKGGLLDIPGKRGYLVLPFDDELLDSVLERSPKLIKECRKLRARMASGQFVKHEALKKRLGA